MLTEILLATHLTAMSAATPPRLEPCPETPNCVSTQAERADQRMDPIPYTTDFETAKRRLLSILEAQPRTEIGEIGERTIHAVFITRLLRFRDDVHFLFDPEARLIHFRSASRIGRRDMGTNRERMERLTAEFLAAETAGGASE